VEGLVERHMKPTGRIGVAVEVHLAVWDSRPSKGLVAIEASQLAEYLQDYDDK
jgi:hypothetical protein